MDMMRQLALFGGVIPGFVATLVLGVAWYLHARKVRLELGDQFEEEESDLEETDQTEVGAGPRFLLPGLLAAAVIIADMIPKGGIKVWPDANTDRVTHAVALLGVLGIVEGVLRPTAWIVTAARAAVYGAAGWMLMEGYVPGVMSTAELWGWVALAGLGGAGWAHAADEGLERVKGWTGPAAALVMVAGASGVMQAGGFSSGPMALTGALAVLSAALLVGFVAPTIAISQGGVTVLVGLVIAGVIGAGVQSEPKSVPGLLLLLLSPLALGLVFDREERTAKRTLLVRIVVLGLMLGAAFGLMKAADAALDDADEASGYEAYE